MRNYTSRYFVSLLLVSTLVVALTAGCARDLTTNHNLRHFEINGFRLGGIINEDTVLTPAAPLAGNQYDHNYEQIRYSLDERTNKIRKMIVPVYNNGADCKINTDSNGYEHWVMIDQVIDYFGSGNHGWQDREQRLQYVEYKYVEEQHTAVVRFVYNENNKLVWVTAESNIEEQAPVSPMPTVKTDSRKYDIEYFTDRVDEMIEYVPETPVAFVITAEYGRYHFSDNEMSQDMAFEYVDAFEPGIKSAIEWFGHNGDLLDLYFVQRDFEALNTQGLPEGESLYGTDDLPLFLGSGAEGVAYFEYSHKMEPLPSPFFVSHVLMHEAVHALCDVHSEITNFPRRPQPYPFHWSESMLEEGLATMLEHMYGYDNGRLHDIYAYHYASVGLNTTDGMLDTVGDVSEALGHLAHHEMNVSDFFDELPYDILQSYGTAASFLYYLLEYNNSPEDVRRVFVDINLMDEVYGKDMNEMIVEWLEYIEQYK